MAEAPRDPEWSDVVEFKQPPASVGDMSDYVNFQSPGQGALKVLKAGGAGLIRGTAALAGSPGAATRGAARGLDKLTGTPGMVTDDKQRMFPTPEEIVGHVEKNWTGPLPAGDTPLERGAETFGEMVPSSVIFGGNPVSNVLRFAAPAAVTSTVAESVAPKELQPAARTIGAIAGGGVGAITRPSTALRFMRDQLPDYVDQNAVMAAGGLVRDAAREGMTLTWPEALSRVTGRPVLSDVQRILESSRQSKATMSEALAPRPEQVRQAGEDVAASIGQPMLPEHVGRQVGEAAQDTLTSARQIINRATDPFYQAAEGIRLTPQEWAQARAVPGFDEALAQVRNDPQLNRYVSHLPDHSVGVLNEVKKLLDQSAENAAGPMNAQRNMQRAAGFGASATDVRTAATGAAQRAVGPGNVNPYDIALQIQRDSRERFLQPLLDGPLGKLAKEDLTTQQAIEALFPKNRWLAAKPVSAMQCALFRSAILWRPVRSCELIRSQSWTRLSMQQ
jgi:hypothetical protein